MGELCAHNLIRFSVSQVETSFRPETKRRDEWLWTIAQFVIGMPSQMIISISVLVDQ
jgi:hypothetical protein